MANATFYSYSKRHNSTAVPSSGTVVDVQLKGGSDLIDPVFTINNSGVPSWSMMSYEGRYYFITDIKSVRNDLWEISCHVDVLATYKSNVQATSAYVLYHTHTNTELADKRLGVKTTAVVDTEAGAFESLGATAPDSCVVLVSIVGENSTATYAMSQANAKALLNDFDNWYQNAALALTPFPSGQFLDVISALTWIAQFYYESGRQLIATGKAGDSIKNAFMLPLSLADVGGTPENVVLGKYQTSISGNRIDYRCFGDDASVQIPWQATDWRRNAPYHEIFLYIPYIGLINISPSDVIDLSFLNVQAELDLLSGDAIFTVYGGSWDRVIGQYNTNLAAPYAIGASNITPMAAATSLISGAATVASAFATGGVSIAVGTAGLIGMTNNLQAQPTSIGANAGGAALGMANRQQVICFTVFHDTVDTPSSMSATVGTPTNETISLGSVSGYVQTAAASVSGAMTDQEREEINKLLDGGVYIE